MIYRVAYVSTASHAFSEEEIQDLLVKARDKNKGLDITGVLIHRKGHFLQILEGPEQNVEELYEVISHDPRHEAVSMIHRQYDEDRIFKLGWYMAYKGFEEYSEDIRSLIEDMIYSKSGGETVDSRDELIELARSIKNVA
ncbi:BLUF domain-containing protein [Pseudobacteriovorax antillogorgiicola]|uniref:Sensors of blue-light using FAD n=1 Tax=Pseudobacteriovorax antillogorgiicola TaxID=1513793 RepID=A0A1Y6BL32_9BACT|nr:BLUF domain-containing protein [Pseudobacteriovorax antillogorgiicola]TCS56236.1 FAD-dependent sensor of blue light [Pseudobacteriovorax antillogorgiicola]SMF08177.1 Sensors of blue-light using FAD [Pseudobacteriovorax antillogorgiicola]